MDLAKLFSSNLMYSSELSYLLGCYFADYLKASNAVPKIYREFIKIIEKPADSVATSRGMRSDDMDNFFGEKGYAVVYQGFNKEQTL